jgi:hypothetical protein
MAKRTNPQSEAADTTTEATTAQSKQRRSRGSVEQRGKDSEPPRSAATSPADPNTSQPAAAPTEEDIRRRAYHRYLERGGGHGMDFQDWLDAEQELKSNRKV